jgi:hypothetical protein
MLIYDLLRNPKAQSGAEVSLCAEEWIEDSGTKLRVDTAAIIGKYHTDASSRRTCFGRVFFSPNLEMPSRLQCVESI